jgi:hypothetical protein
VAIQLAWSTYRLGTPWQTCPTIAFMLGGRYLETSLRRRDGQNQQLNLKAILPSLPFWSLLTKYLDIIGAVRQIYARQYPSL